MAPIQKVLVTGASGFVGAWLLRGLQDETRHGTVEILTAGRDGSLDFPLDVSQADEVETVIQQAAPTSVIHLAAIAAPAEARQNPSVAWDVNFRGSQNIANAILKYRPECRLVFAGSSEAYGKSFVSLQGAPVPEETALAPMTTYSATKAAADVMIGQMHYEGLRAVRFRPFNHTGPGQTDKYVVPAFASQIARALAGKTEPVLRVGRLDVARDFVDVRDIVRAYTIAALDHNRDIDGKVYNLARGESTEVGWILKHLVALSDAEISIETNKELLRPNDVPAACGDAGAAARDLGWKPEIELTRTLSDVLDYWREKALH